MLPGGGVSIGPVKLPKSRGGPKQHHDPYRYGRVPVSPLQQAANYQHFVQIEEESHPLLGRSVRRSVRNFRKLVTDIFSSRWGKGRGSSRTVGGLGDDNGKPERPSMVTRLLRLAKGDGMLNLLATVFMLVAAGIEVAVPHYTSEALSAVLLNKGKKG